MNTSPGSVRVADTPADSPMRAFKARGTQIDAMAACVPSRVVTNAEMASTLGERTARRFGAITGILERRVSSSETSFDLCVAAAQKIAQETDGIDEVDCVIFVSQTADFVLPSSAALAQHSLGLPTTCSAFDVSLGCSGYVYAMWLAASLLQSGACSKVLLLAGDTITKTTDPKDRATHPIFGDAGTATVISVSESESIWNFLNGTDGSGASAIIVPNSGYRQRPLEQYALGPEASDGKLYMNGQSVFNFTANVIPDFIKRLLAVADRAPNDVEGLHLHQANILILKTIARKIGIDTSRLSISLDRFGNTSCASIPLTLVAAPVTEKPHNAVLCGFGVGLSWSGMEGRLNDFPRFLIDFDS